MTEDTHHHEYNTTPHPAMLGEGPIETGPADFGDPGIVHRKTKHYRHETIHWLEPGRIAMGKVNMIAGDPGLGKSFMTMELAARASRGEIGSSLASVVVMSAEDDPCDTIVPRLKNMAANLNNVHFIEGIRREPGGCIDLLTLDRDMERFEKMIEEIFPVSLIVIDPISAYMGKADSNNNAEVRAVLARLSSLAARTGAAVVCVTHLNKDNGNARKAVYRTMGSLAFTAAARTVQLVTKYEVSDGHSDEHAKDKRIVSMVKNNLGPIVPARVFIVRNGICTWLDEQVDVEADHFANGRVTFDAPETGRDKALEFLTRMLGASPQPTREIFERGAAQGLSEGMLKNAKEAMGAVSFKQGKVWYWSREGIDTSFEADLRDALEEEPRQPFEPEEEPVEEPDHERAFEYEPGFELPADLGDYEDI
ncbi:MAG: AAA family ATPase [Phycisphaerales bacterium]